jgi:hypothetical protein
MIVLLVLALLSAIMAIVSTIVSGGYKIPWIMTALICGVITLIIGCIAKFGIFNTVIWSIYIAMTLFILVARIKKPSKL